MVHKNRAQNLDEALKIDCGKCFGFCCVALYFSASEGFPTDKEAGNPCINLCDDFKCAVHKELRKNGLKGCTAYDCFGAGQKVAQVTYKGQDWHGDDKIAKEMFEVFLILRQLHEMLWYLKDAFKRKIDGAIKDSLSELVNETGQLTFLDSKALLALDIEKHRNKVNFLLEQTSELLRTKALRGQKNTLKRKKMIAGRLDCIGADLRKTNLKGADLRGALLIAANLSGVDLSFTDLIGADLRDTDIRGANLTDSLFISQGQINTARGDSNTKLPIALNRPAYWDK